MTLIINQLQQLNSQLDDFIATSAFREQLGPELLANHTPAYLEISGKRLRPTLLFIGCGIVGGDPTKLIPAAAAYEIFHNWTLVHDDIIDNDDMRRHHPTAHNAVKNEALTRYQLSESEAQRLGLQAAILIGDELQSWSIHSFLQLSRTTDISANVILSEIERLTGEAIPLLIHGEMLDVINSYIPADRLTTEELNHMMFLKTSVLFQYALTAGAVLGSGTPFQHLSIGETLNTFAKHFGLAFQMQDDLLGMCGESQQLGKAVGADLREGKKTLLLVYALNKVPEQERQKLLNALGNKNLSNEDLEECNHILNQHLVYEDMEQQIELHLNMAQNALTNLPQNQWTEHLNVLTQMIKERKK